MLRFTLNGFPIEKMRKLIQRRRLHGE